MREQKTQVDSVTPKKQYYQTIATWYENKQENNIYKSRFRELTISQVCNVSPCQEDAKNNVDYGIEGRKDIMKVW
jgi:hypothetical protein